MLCFYVYFNSKYIVELLIVFLSFIICVLVKYSQKILWKIQTTIFRFRQSWAGRSRATCGPSAASCSSCTSASRCSRRTTTASTSPWWSASSVPYRTGTLHLPTDLFYSSSIYVAWNTYIEYVVLILQNGTKNKDKIFLPWQIRLGREIISRPIC